MLTLLLLVQVSGERPLNLACLGRSPANVSTPAFHYPRPDHDEQVEIRLSAEGDRIWLPKSILPLIHGGSGGWFKLKDVVVDGSRIRGRAAINFANHLEVAVDRATGSLAIGKKADVFTGQCRDVGSSPE